MGKGLKYLQTALGTKKDAELERLRKFRDIALAHYEGADADLSDEDFEHEELRIEKEWRTAVQEERRLLAEPE